MGDDRKRAEYDNQATHYFSDVQFDTRFFNDIFSQAFGGGRNHPFGDFFTQQQQRNRNHDLNLRHTISLADSFTGKQFNVNFTLPSGKNQDVVIDIPAGVVSGMNINYDDLGDDSIPNIPRGNLHVTILVNDDPNFKRINDDLVSFVEINPIESIIGCKKIVTSIGGEEIHVGIKPGLQAGMRIAKQGKGFKNIHNGRFGDFISIIKIKTPTVKDVNLINELTRINNILNKA